MCVSFFACTSSRISKAFLILSDNKTSNKKLISFSTDNLTISPTVRIRTDTYLFAWLIAWPLCTVCACWLERDVFTTVPERSNTFQSAAGLSAELEGCSITFSQQTGICRRALTVSAKVVFPAGNQRVSSVAPGRFLRLFAGSIKIAVQFGTTNKLYLQE